MLAGSQFFCKRGAADAPVRWTGEDARPSICNSQFRHEHSRYDTNPR